MFFIVREGVCGEPEVAALAELQLKDRTSPVVGDLLRDALHHLPSIRGCYLTHLAHMESSVLSSRDRYLGRTPFVSSHLLPELTGPSLPSDWPFLPLISLYERMGMSAGGGHQVESLSAGSVQSVTHCLQWLLVLENWREQALMAVPPVAKLARLACVFLCSSDLFLERPVKELTWALFRRLIRPAQLGALDLGSPPPGLASFHDLYSALLVQYEAVSFGDPLFGCFMLLPLQRRYSVTMRLAVFGEHVGMLRSLRVSLQQVRVVFLSGDLVQIRCYRNMTVHNIRWFELGKSNLVKLKNALFRIHPIAGMHYISVVNSQNWFTCFVDNIKLGNIVKIAKILMYFFLPWKGSWTEKP